MIYKIRTYFKRILVRIYLWDILYQVFSYVNIKKNATILVHVGKCGGRTLNEGLKKATVNSDVHLVHINKPVYRADLKYIIIARNPIARLQSAFRWRYKIVIEDGRQDSRFCGEKAVLSKYPTLNSIAEELYNDDGFENKSVIQDFNKIHHIREDIDFYLSSIIKLCSPDQIEAVLMQENLDSDILRVFGYKNELYEHRNSSNSESDRLSDKAIKNLKRYLVNDYQALLTLHLWGKIDDKVIDRVFGFSESEKD